MEKHAGSTRAGAGTGCVPKSRAPAPALRMFRTRQWVSLGLACLATAWGAGLFVAAAGARLRRASPAGLAGPNAAIALRDPMPTSAPTSSRAGSPAPPPAVPAPAASSRAADTAESRAGASAPAEGQTQPALTAAGAADPPVVNVRSLGRELFARTWRPDDPRCHGGDGLGPVYNADSCLACHSLGGPGGAGSADQNVELATGIGYTLSPNSPMLSLNRVLGDQPGFDMVTTDPDPADLVKVHPGFRDAASAVVHRFSVDPDYSRWRETFRSESRPVPTLPESFPERSGGGRPSNSFSRSRASARFPARGKRPLSSFNLTYLSDRQCRPFVPVTAEDRALVRECLDELGAKDVAFSITARNPPALFGAGLIDGLADSDLEKAPAQQPYGTRGRVHRLKDGRIGRFGWRAQVASLEDFVLGACANELGLEVPGHHQAVSPQAPDAQSKGLDLTAEECGALVAYVRSLPPPASPEPTDAEAAIAIAEGRKLFQSVGCAICHRPDLGSVQGIYSDLLLHDMGEPLSDPGSYDTEGSDSRDRVKRGEWRTPPLWGVRDSAPYLHDGRAPSLEQAVALHGGQGAGSARRFRSLGTLGRAQVLAFLNSLSAPAPEPAP